MVRKKISCHVAGWYGIAGGIKKTGDWLSWARGHLPLRPTIEKPILQTIPGRISRRLNTLGKSVMSVCETCLPICDPDTAVISVSRHGDLASLDNLVERSRNRLDISPTAFSYSVHNRFSSLVSMLSGFHGVNAAYSSTRDGFPMALAEAVGLIEKDSSQCVLIIAYEPEVPASYTGIIQDHWFPHVAAFVLKRNYKDLPAYSLVRHSVSISITPDSGTCLSLIRTMMSNSRTKDGFWEYRANE